MSSEPFSSMAAAAAPASAAPQDTSATPTRANGIEFIKGQQSVKFLNSATGESFAESVIVEKIREELAGAMNAKNVAFLFGSGCSSLQDDAGKQIGIPTMKPLAVEFTTGTTDAGSNTLLTTDDKNFLNTQLGIDVTDTRFKHNLEALMEVLFSWKFSFTGSKVEDHAKNLTCVESIILKLKTFLFERCTKGAFASGDDGVQHLYESFYRKLIFRERSLPRPWVFTTNYDLFNETAMDRLGLPYSNGFTGTIERRFNPSVFRYALAEQLDITSRKWSAVDGFVYLCKLHGSISWVDDSRESGLFPVREMQRVDDNYNALLIYPTPAKQTSTFASPYSDLFREFQSRIVREQSVLFVLGYSFGDQHVNNIIYQALTVPTFRLVIFGNPTGNVELEKLRALQDSRIWIIGGEASETKRTSHYFDYFVENFMPELPGGQVEKAVSKVLSGLFERKFDSAEESEAKNGSR